MTTKTIAVLPVSHVDHDLSDAQLAWLIDRANEYLLLPDTSSGLLKLTLTLPEEFGAIPCGLHGPVMGDEPVGNDEVEPGRRGERLGDSRLCARPPRQVRKVSLIAGPHEDQPWVLFTAFGGPIAPREPGELTPTECLECNGRGMIGTMDIPYPGQLPAQQCPNPACFRGKVPHPERAESDAFWAEHALSR